MKILKIAATAALLASGATLALAQTTTPTTPSDPKSSATPTDPKKAPSAAGQNQAPGQESGSRPIGPPADATKPANPSNPFGESKAKQKADQDDPLTGGKKK